MESCITKVVVFQQGFQVKMLNISTRKEKHYTRYTTCTLQTPGYMETFKLFPVHSLFTSALCQMLLALPWAQDW